MKIKTILTSINASFDRMVRKIENHEAVAGCVIHEVRESAAKIRGQLNLACARRATQSNQEKQLLDDCQRWRERAVACKDNDEEKALRCVQSLKHSEKALATLRQQTGENQRLIEDLENHLADVEQRLSDLQNKRESLSARAARNKVACHVQQHVAFPDHENIFERWETQVIADEYITTPCVNNADSLDREFRQLEDRLSLEAELNALVENYKPLAGEGK